MPPFYQERVHIVLPLLLSAVLLAVGVLLFKFDSTPQSAQFSLTSAFVVWVFLMAVQAGLLAVVALPLTRALRQLERHFTRSRLEVALSALAFALLFSLPSGVPRMLYLSEGSWPLAHHSAKAVMFAVVTFVVSLLAVLGMLLVRSALSSLFTEEDRTDRDFHLYRGLLDYAENFLFILGGIVGIATLSLGALRRALLAVGYSGNVFPPLLVLAYGSYFSLLVALIYLPVFAAQRQAGYRLVDRFFPIQSPATATWADQLGKRQMLERMLQLEPSVEQRLRSGVAILTPLLGGGVAVLLG